MFGWEKGKKEARPFFFPLPPILSEAEVNWGFPSSFAGWMLLRYH